LLRSGAAHVDVRQRGDDSTARRSFRSGRDRARQGLRAARRQGTARSAMNIGKTLSPLRHVPSVLGLASERPTAS
jgi:hypothetical protein